MDMMMTRSLAGRRVSMELLWENASPTSEMAGGTAIGIARITEYSHVMVIYSLGTYQTNAMRESCVIVPAEAGRIAMLSMCDAAYDNNVKRDIEITSSGLSVGTGSACSKGTIKTSNGNCIPHRIYGIKGVIGNG